MRIKKIIMFLMLAMIQLVLFRFEIKATGLSVDALAEQYTEDDTYYVNGTMYNIEDYVESGSTEDFADRGVGYGQRFIINGSSYKFDNNDIVNIIPEELFFNVGTYSYIGKEYGFYISTELVNNGMNYRSKTILYDLDYILPNIFSNNATVTFKVISNCVYDCYVRSMMGDLGNIIANDKDRVVTYLYTPNITEGVTISNVEFTSEINNRNHPNPGDSDYQLIDNSTIELIDKGDFIHSYSLDVHPKVVPANQVNQLTQAEEFIYVGLKKIIKATKVLSPMLWLKDLDDELVTLVKGDVQGTYVSYMLNIAFDSLENQVLGNDKYVRLVSGCTKSEEPGGLDPLFAPGDYCVSKTTFSGPLSYKDRRSMNLNMGISLTVNHPNSNQSMRVSSSRDFVYDRGAEICMKNENYTLQIDDALGQKIAYFYSQDTNPIQFVTSTSSIKINIYDENMNLIKSGYGSVSLKNPQICAYYIFFYGASNRTFTFSISPSHYHNYNIYNWINSTQHRATCSCGDSIYEGHAVSSDAFSDGSQTAICLLCGGEASMGFIQNSVKILISDNGSYVLSNGIVVLQKEDIYAYLNHTLVFRRANESID